MKKEILAMFITVLIGGTVLTSCQSKEEKVEAAKEEVHDAKQDLKEAQKELNSEYPTFKTDADKRIAANEERIEDLRKKINTGGKPLDNARAKRIEELKEENAKLRSRLYGYENERGDWESFKREFNHDMDGLGTSLEDLGKDNKK